MPEYYVSVEYRLKIKAKAENIAAVAAQSLEPAECSFAEIEVEGIDIIAISEEKDG